MCDPSCADALAPWGFANTGDLARAMAAAFIAGELVGETIPSLATFLITRAATRSYAVFAIRILNWNRRGCRPTAFWNDNSCPSGTRRAFRHGFGGRAWYKADRYDDD